MHQFGSPLIFLFLNHVGRQDCKMRWKKKYLSLFKQSLLFMIKQIYVIKPLSEILILCKRNEMGEVFFFMVVSKSFNLSWRLFLLLEIFHVFVYLGINFMTSPPPIPDFS